MGRELPDLPRIIHLWTVRKGDQRVSIIETRFAQGEDFEFGLLAKLINFGLGDEFVREDGLDLCATLSSKGFDLFDSGSYPVSFGFREERACEVEFHFLFLNSFRKFHCLFLPIFQVRFQGENEIRSFCSCTGPWRR